MYVFYVRAVNSELRRRRRRTYAGPRRYYIIYIGGQRTYTRTRLQVAPASELSGSVVAALALRELYAAVAAVQGDTRPGGSEKVGVMRKPVGSSHLPDALPPSSPPPGATPLFASALPYTMHSNGGRPLLHRPSRRSHSTPPRRRPSRARPLPRRSIWRCRRRPLFDLLHDEGSFTSANLPPLNNN